MDLLTINEIAAMLKTSEGVAKQIMGHANLTMILKHYQHTIREQKRTAMNAISIPPEEDCGYFRGYQGPKKAPKSTHEEKNVLQ